MFWGNRGSSTELISKLNLLEDDEQLAPGTSSNPFHDADELNPFGGPDEEGELVRLLAFPLTSAELSGTETSELCRRLSVS